jgi:hypothetical protein
MSLAAITGVFWLISDTVNVDVSLFTGRILRYAAVAELVAAGAIVSRVRSGMPLQRADTDLDVWWSDNGRRVMVTWALAHSSAITAAVFWLLSGDTIILAAVVVAAILLLLRLGPGHWRSEEPRPSRLVP